MYLWTKAARRSLTAACTRRGRGPRALESRDCSSLYFFRTFLFGECTDIASREIRRQLRRVRSFGTGLWVNLALQHRTRRYRKRQRCTRHMHAHFDKALLILAGTIEKSDSRTLQSRMSKDLWGELRELWSQYRECFPAMRTRKAQCTLLPDTKLRFNLLYDSRRQRCPGMQSLE